VPFEAKSRLTSSVEISTKGKQMGVGTKASSSGHSFTGVVRATASSAAVPSELKTLPLGHLDLFPVADCFEWTNGGENPRLAVDCSKLEKNLKRAEADSVGIIGSVKKAKKKKSTLINRSQKKILEYAWRKMFDWIKAKVGHVVGFGLDQLPSVRGVRLGWFLSKPKLVGEKVGSGFVEGNTGTHVGLGSRLVAGPRFSSDPESALSHEVAISSSSMVMALSSSASKILEVRQGGSSQEGLSSAMEDVAQSSQVFENPIAPRFVFPPLPTSSPDPLFAAAGFSATVKGMLSSVSLEGSLRSEGPSPTLVSNGVGSVELRIQPTSTKQNSLLYGDLYSRATEPGERIRLSIPA
jgi:hypothetical protein